MLFWCWSSQVFGRQSLVRWLSIPCDVPNLQLTIDVFSSFTGGVSVVVAIIVCNMSVIIPAMLRALGAGNPFMQDDTVDLNYNTIEMACTTSTRIELGLPTTRGTAITESDESEGSVGAVTSLQQHSVNLCVKEDRKCQLDAGLGRVAQELSTTKIVPLADDPSFTGSLV